MVRAAARGAIDFAQTDLMDPAWWRHLVEVLEVVEDEAYVQANLTSMTLTAAQLARASGDELGDLQERAVKAHDNVRRLLLPWVAPPRAAHTDIEEIYRREIGNPDDPAFMERLRASVQEEARRKAEARARGKGPDSLAERLKARDRARGHG
jgi:hypothetical protein